jgi:hypothetical protein
LPSKHKAISVNPSTTRKKKKKEGRKKGRQQGRKKEKKESVGAKSGCP